MEAEGTGEVSSRDAVLKTMQRSVISQWIHFSVGEVLVEVVFNSD